jgi:ubiquitin carboxyl-terminal hydrolase 7
LEIDLSDFLTASADKSVSYNYKLHGVLVHAGDVHGGHYFGMIKPTKNSQWFRYDDERVIPVTIEDVLDENFGGDGGAYQNGLLNIQSRQQRTSTQWKRFTSAYMLVYLRESLIDEILAPITPADIPQHVVRRVEEDRNEAIRRKREKEEMHLYITVKIIDIGTFQHHDGVDLASFDPLDKNAQEWVHSFRVRRDLTWLGFYQHIAEANQTTRDNIRLWHLVNRQNKTVRPDVPIPPDYQLSILLHK